MIFFCFLFYHLLRERWIISYTKPHSTLSGNFLKHNSWGPNCLVVVIASWGLGGTNSTALNFSCTNLAPFENNGDNLLKISNFKHSEPRVSQRWGSTLSGQHSTLFSGGSLSKTTSSPWLAYKGMVGFSSSWVGEPNVGQAKATYVGRIMLFRCSSKYIFHFSSCFLFLIKIG